MRIVLVNERHVQIVNVVDDVLVARRAEQNACFFLEQALHDRLESQRVRLGVQVHESVNVLIFVELLDVVLHAHCLACSSVAHKHDSVVVLHQLVEQESETGCLRHINV